MHCTECTRLGAVYWQQCTTCTLYRENTGLYIKLLDFADFAVQTANSRIGPFASPVLNLNHLIHKKSENLQWEKCRYITGREKTFSDTAQYFLLKHLKKLPKCHEKHFFSMKWCFRAKKIFSKIDCELLHYANLTKLIGS